MTEPISDAEIDIIVNTSPIQAIAVGEVTNQPVAFDVGEVPNLISNGLPGAGATGQHLAKKSDNDYDTQWVTPHDVPSGGTSGQKLVKNSATDYDASWATSGNVPSGGAVGQVLGKKTATDYDTQWTAPVTIADTTTVDLTGDGSAANALRADVLPAGLASKVPITVADTATVDLSGDGTAANALKADVLSVPAGKAAIATSSSAEITLSGNGAGTPLSAALTGTRNGNFNLASGAITVPLGAVTSGAKGAAGAYGLFAARDAMLGSVSVGYGWSANGATALRFVHDDGADIALYLNHELQAGVTTGGVARPIPFATAAYAITVTVTSAVGATNSINHKVGLFTQAPIATCSGYNVSTYVSYVSNATVGSVSVGLSHRDGTSGSITAVVNVICMQMTPGASGGPTMARASEPAPEPKYARFSTCHTEGCDNEDIRVGNVEPEGDIWCGPCGQRITDIVAA